MAEPARRRVERQSGCGAVTLDARFRHSVMDYISKSGMKATEFGVHAVGSSGFVARLNKMQSVSLDTADRVLDFMGETPIGPMFRREVEAFLEVTGIGETSLNAEAAGSTGFVKRLRSGASPKLSTVDRVQVWMRTIATRSEHAAIARMLRDGEEVRTASARNRGTRLGRRTVARRWSADKKFARGEDVLAHDSRIFLSSRQAGRFLNISPRTLERYRTKGEGPAYCMAGQRVLYARADLLAWVWKRRHSTAESD